MKGKRFKYVLAFMLAVTCLGTSTTFAAEITENSVGMDIQESDLIINSDEMSEGDSVLPSLEQLTNVDVERKGEITIRLTDGKEGAIGAGVQFSCDKVAEIVQGEYVLTEAYQESGVDLNQIENSAGMEEAAFQLAEFMETADGKETDQNGEVVFRNLDTGVYLVKAEDNPNYDMVSPSLVSIPTWDENKGEMCYETVLEPKHTPRQGKPEEPGENFREVPQTGLHDHTMAYLAAAAVSFLSAFLLWMVARISKRGKRK